MSNQIYANIYIARHGIEDILVEVDGTYAPPVIPFRNDPDDCAEVQVNGATVAASVWNAELGVFHFEAGERICLTDAEEAKAEEALFAAA